MAIVKGVAQSLCRTSKRKTTNYLNSFLHNFLKEISWLSLQACINKSLPILFKEFMFGFDDNVLF